MNKQVIERLTLNQFHLVPFSFDKFHDGQKANITVNLLTAAPYIQEIHYLDDTIEIKGPAAKDIAETVYLDDDKITATLLNTLGGYDTDVSYHSVINVIGPRYVNYIYITIHFIEP